LRDIDSTTPHCGAWWAASPFPNEDLCSLAWPLCVFHPSPSLSLAWVAVAVASAPRWRPTSASRSSASPLLVRSSRAAAADVRAHPRRADDNAVGEDDASRAYLFDLRKVWLAARVRHRTPRPRREGLTRCARPPQDFDHADKDKNGFLDADELRDLLKKLYTPSKEEIEAFVTFFDTNRFLLCICALRAVPVSRSHPAATARSARPSSSKASTSSTTTRVAKTSAPSARAPSLPSTIPTRPTDFCPARSSCRLPRRRYTCPTRRSRP
jgi:hypothetical protein